MPIVGPASYFVVTQAVINHWNDANAANGAPIVLNKDALKVASDVEVANLATLLAELEEKRDIVEDISQNLSIKRAVALSFRALMLRKLGDFNALMRAEHCYSVYGQILATAPNLAAGRDTFMRAMRDTARLWAKVNTWLSTQAKPNLLTKGGYTQSEFLSALTECRNAMEGFEELEQQLAIDIKIRDKTQGQIYPILKVYRLKLPTVFAEGHAMIATLPSLTPEPGSTPAAPGLVMGWNGANLRTEGTGTRSPSASVTQTQLRGAIGSNAHNNAGGARLQISPTLRPLARAVVSG